MKKTKNDPETFCPACWTFGHSEWRDARAFQRAGLSVGWTDICVPCFEAIDAFVTGQQSPKGLLRMVSGVRTMLPHPDSTRPRDCAECEVCASHRLVAAERAVPIVGKQGEIDSYEARYRCAHGEAHDVYWRKDLRVDLTEEVWSYHGNARKLNQRPEITVSGPIPNTPLAGEDDMQRYVRFYKDGDAMAISTNVVDETEFQMLVPAALADFLDTATKKQDRTNWIAASMPLIVDLSCKLRGYKAPLVDEQRVLTAGKIPPRDALLSSSSEDVRPEELRDADRKLDVSPV